MTYSIKITDKWWENYNYEFMFILNADFECKLLVYKLKIKLFVSNNAAVQLGAYWGCDLIECQRKYLDSYIP